jgi:uncharacterized protein YcbK (DUF882 family)
MSINWSDYKNFSEYEFRCSYTGECQMRPEFLDKLQQIRNTFDKPMIISSGFRHFTHPLERAKDEPGEHTYGVAVDINVWGEEAMELFDIAYHYGIRRIGINQKGAPQSRFVHLGMGDILNLRFPSALWTY